MDEANQQIHEAAAQVRELLQVTIHQVQPQKGDVLVINFPDRVPVRQLEAFRQQVPAALVSHFGEENAPLCLTLNAPAVEVSMARRAEPTLTEPCEVVVAKVGEPGPNGDIVSAEAALTLQAALKRAPKVLRSWFYGNELRAQVVHAVGPARDDSSSLGAD